MITHGMKIGGALALGFGLFACGNSANITQGTVTSVKYEPGHMKQAQVCKTRIGARCTKYVKKLSWDDADYKLQLSDGRNTSWVEVGAGVFHSCPVNVKYPACATVDS